MVVEGVDRKYKHYLNQKNTRWDFGNSILYKMCEEYPKHNDADVITGKIWLIGRSYAAAIERRKNTSDYHEDEDYYYSAVAPKMIEIGSELDYRISRLSQSYGRILDEVDVILSTHKFLMDVFYEITELNKRSLASKYLHFHCPEKFFIYDSRARGAIGRLVKRPKKNILSEIETDNEYGDFVCRMLELQGYLENKLGIYELPRRMDGFLLGIDSVSVYGKEPL